MNTGAMPSGVYPKVPKKVPSSLGFARYTLNLDGTDDYIRVADSPSLGIADEITIGLSLKADLDGSVLPSHFIGKRTPGKWSSEYSAWYRGNGEIGWGIFNIGSVVTPVGSLSSERTHICLRYNGSRIELDLNGKLVKDEPASGTIIQNDQPIIIGAREDLRHFVGGLIDYLWIYNRALSASEKQYNIVNYNNLIRSGLVLWLSMEEGAGEIVYDKSGHGNHGTLLPAGMGPTWERLRQWELRSAVE